MDIIKHSNYDGNHSVVQSNEFIQRSNWRFNTVQLKLLKLLISCIDTVEPPADHTVYVKKRDLLSFSDAKGKGELSYISKQLKSLITAVDIIDEAGKKKSVALLTDIMWESSTDLVGCKFHDNIWPYVTELKEHFLQYNVMQIKKFKSKFSIILYENLLSYTKQTGLKVIKVSMPVLRLVTGTEKKYKKFGDFEENVLKVAQKEINEDEFIGFLFTYEKVKKGREYSDIIFYLRTRTSFEDTLDYTKYPENLSQPIRH